MGEAMTPFCSVCGQKFESSQSLGGHIKLCKQKHTLESNSNGLEHIGNTIRQPYFRMENGQFCPGFIQGEKKFWFDRRTKTFVEFEK